MNPFEAAQTPADASQSPKRSPEIVVMPEKYYGVALKMDARDMDAKAPAAAPMVPAVPPPPPKPKQPIAPMSEEKTSPWPYIALVAVILLLIGGGFVYFNRDALFGKKPPVTQPPVVTQPTKNPPAAPTNLVAASASGTQSVSLSWRDAANDETGFRIERAGSDGLFAVLTNLPANSTSFLDVSVAAGIQYRYRISAVNEGGVSTASGEASALVAAVSPTAPTLPPGGLDSDSDGLSDSEEAVFGTDARNPDTDHDGFLDGNEVFHLYNPAAQAPVRLLDTTLVKNFSASLGWSLYAPSTWTSSLDVADGQKASLVTGQGERFVIEVLPNAQKLSAQDWYLAAHTTTTADMLRQLTTKQGLEGVLSPDRLEAVFSWGEKVFTFRYDPGTKPYINYRTIYEMMLNSLKLEGAPLQPVSPADSLLNGPGDVVGASATATVPTATSTSATTTESILIPSATSSS
ncbi:MAG: fibronectin type III domain-containing protein [Patescibacteria group bacterium]